MLQAVMRKGRRRRSGFVWVRRGDQDGLTTQPHRDALLARIKCAGRVDTAGNFGAEHGLKKPGLSRPGRGYADGRDRIDNRALPASYPGSLIR